MWYKNIEETYNKSYDGDTLEGEDVYFRRKAYNQLIDWKNNYADRYAVLLEGPRRVGKSTIAENFARNEYKSYILLDFSKVTNNILECFDDIGNLTHGVHQHPDVPRHAHHGADIHFAPGDEQRAAHQRHGRAQRAH